MTTDIILFVSTFIAFFVKGLTGFANTLVLGSLYSFVIPNRITTPVDLIFSFPTNAWMVWKNRGSISIKTLLTVSPILIAGIIPGAMLLKYGSQDVLKTALGLVVIGMAVEMALRRNGGAKSRPVLFFITTIVSGLLTGLFGIGALLVGMLSRSSENRSKFKANICGIFMAENLFRIIYYAVIGLFNTEALWIAIKMLPAVILGMLAGFAVDKRMDEKASKTAVIILLIITGAVLTVKSAIEMM